MCVIYKYARIVTYKIIRIYVYVIDGNNKEIISK